MSASRRRQRRLALVRSASAPAPDPKPVVPADSGYLHRDRVIVPFVIVEHESSKGRSVGILVLDPAAA
jgi:hypothetical protein